MRIQTHNNFKLNQTMRHNLSFKGLEAIIFDADGTMVVSAPYHEEAWGQFALKYKPEIPGIDYKKAPAEMPMEKLRNFPRQGTTEEVIKSLFKNLSPTEVKEYAQTKEDFFLKAAKNIKEVEGLKKFIESIKDIKKGIATCAYPSSVDLYIKVLGLTEHFNPQHIIDATKVTKGKPDPEVYLKAAEALKVLTKDCIVFEDSREGILSAKNAGMKIIGVATSLSKETLVKLGANLAIANFTEIDLAKILSLFAKV